MLVWVSWAVNLRPQGRWAPVGCAGPGGRAPLPVGLCVGALVGPVVPRARVGVLRSKGSCGGPTAFVCVQGLAARVGHPRRRRICQRATEIMTDHVILCI